MIKLGTSSRGNFVQAPHQVKECIVEVDSDKDRFAGSCSIVRYEISYAMERFDDNGRVDLTWQQFNDSLSRAVQTVNDTPFLPMNTPVYSEYDAYGSTYFASSITKKAKFGWSFWPTTPPSPPYPPGYGPFKLPDVNPVFQGIVSPSAFATWAVSSRYVIPPAWRINGISVFMNTQYYPVVGGGPPPGRSIVVQKVRYWPYPSNAETCRAVSKNSVWQSCSKSTSSPVDHVFVSSDLTDGMSYVEGTVSGGMGTQSVTEVQILQNKSLWPPICGPK